jgi:hypothetical protein
VKQKKQHQPIGAPKTGIRFYCPDSLVDLAEEMSDSQGKTVSYIYVMAIERGLKVLQAEAAQC